MLYGELNTPSYFITNTFKQVLLRSIVDHGRGGSGGMTCELDGDWGGVVLLWVLKGP